MKKDHVRQCLNKLDIHKSVGFTRIQPQEERVLADVIVRLLSYISERSRWWGNVPENGKQVNCIPWNFQVSKEGWEVSILGDTQNLAGHSPGKLFLVDPALNGDWIRLSPVVLSSLNSCVILWYPVEVLVLEKSDRNFKWEHCEPCHTSHFRGEKEIKILKKKRKREKDHTITTLLGASQLKTDICLN